MFYQRCSPLSSSNQRGPPACRIGTEKHDRAVRPKMVWSPLIFDQGTLRKSGRLGNNNNTVWVTKETGVWRPICPLQYSISECVVGM